MQLPIFNEQYVIDRLVDASAGWSIRARSCEIQVLDDSTDETQSKSHATWWSATPRWDTTSSISTAPIATATRPARSMQG